MSFEDDVMAMANNIAQTAVRVAVAKKEGEETGLFARDGVEGYYAPIPDLFKPYSQMPDPEGHRAMGRSINYALACLAQGGDVQDIMNPVPATNIHLQMIPGASSYLEDWTGRAAVQFKLEFIDPFPAVAQNQYLLGAMLRGGIEAEALMWEKARNDIMDIGNKTLAALNALTGCKHNDGGFTILLSVVEAVATVSAVFTGGLSLGARFAITAVGAAAGVGANWPHEGPEQVGVGGAHTYDIIAGMADAIRRLGSAIYNAELRIRMAMQGAEQLVSSSPDLFVARRPALAGATAATITSPTFMGYSK